MSGMRKLDDHERKASRATAGIMLSGGEHKDDVIHEVADYLCRRGWTTDEARLRAREVVLAVQQALDRQAVRP